MVGQIGEIVRELVVAVCSLDLARILCLSTEVVSVLVPASSNATPIAAIRRDRYTEAGRSGVRVAKAVAAGVNLEHALIPLLKMADVIARDLLHRSAIPKFAHLPTFMILILPC